MSCWDINPLLHLRALSHPHWDPSHSLVLFPINVKCSIAMFQCCPHSCSKSPFLLLSWHLPPIHSLHGSSALASEASWQFLLIFLTLCSLWELALEHRIALSSTSGALQNSLRSGKVQTSMGAFSVPGGLPKSSWTLQHQGRPGPMASPPLRQQRFHCPSVAVNLTGTRSVSHHPSTKLSDSARSFQEGWTDTQSVEKQSPDLSFEPELIKVCSAWGIERGLRGFSSSLGLSSPEAVCKVVVYCLLLQINFSFLAILW